jgi:hypothetical protein
MRKDFFNVPRTYYTTSYTKTQVPMFFYKTALRAVNYFVEHDRVLPLLKGTGLLPVRFFNGKALASLTFFNYQKVTVGAYEEVVLAAVVYPKALGPPSMPFPKLLFAKKEKRWKNMGMYVIEMPVTIPGARAAGREIWGFPKFLTRIPYRLSGNHFQFGVVDPDTDESIVDVKAETGLGFSVKAFDLVSFNNYEDTIFRVATEVDGKIKNCTCKSIEVKVGPSRHRMAESIRALGLDTAKPFVVMSSDYVRTRLNPGKPVADWKSPALPYQYEQEVEFYRRQKELLGERS